MFFLWKLRKPKKFPLTHSLPMHPFSTHWKHQKNLRFSNVFMGLETGCIGNEWVKQKFHSHSAWCNWIIYHIFDLPTNHLVKSDRVRSYSGLHFFRIFPHSDWIRSSFKDWNNISYFLKVNNKDFKWNFNWMINTEDKKLTPI